MKRRKAMHYVRQMIENPAIAYMITYLEPGVDLRRQSVRIYRKYWRYMQADTIILPDFDPDPENPPEEGTVNMRLFSGLTTKHPKSYIVRNLYPTKIRDLKSSLEEDDEIKFNIEFRCVKPEIKGVDETASRMMKHINTWLEGVRDPSGITVNKA